MLKYRIAKHQYVYMDGAPDVPTLRDILNELAEEMEERIVSKDLTREEASRRIKNIKGTSDDAEAAHIMEDELLWEFVKNISEGEYDSCEDAMVVAREIMESKKIDFPRWCA